MSLRNLDRLFKPASVAVLGASEREDAIGNAVFRNLLDGGFNGRLYAVNPKYSLVHGQPCYRDVGALPAVPDLAVLCTPAASVPGLIGALGQRGCGAAVVISAGLNGRCEGASSTFHQQMLEAAQPHVLRIVGPNCLGIQVPGSGLNVSFAHLGAQAGKLAFVSQSGAIVTTVLDWAAARGIGFSHVVSLGEMADVDFGDMLDYLALDPQTSAILLYMESVTHARKFMSAARAAARIKPVVAIKAGRSEAGARAVASHTGALAGVDAVYDAAFRRAGVLRVFDMEELFAAAETLAFTPPLHGERLAIVTNGGGLGILATDALMERRGVLAKLQEGTVARLNELLPAAWSHGNPIDIIGDAPAHRYRAALDAIAGDENIDALLVLNCPTAMASGVDAAQAVIDSIRGGKRPAFTCWAGEFSASHARSLFERNGIATYDTPELAVRAFVHRVEHMRMQRLLTQLPDSASQLFVPDVVAARATIQQAMVRKQEWLSAVDAQTILQAYGVPTVDTRFAQTPAEAARAAQEISTPCVLKITSADITHKSDVGGVALDLESPALVEAAAQAMLARVSAAHPGAKIQGFTVQSMIRRPHARELIVGINEDANFGPVVLFGQGGVDVEAIRDSVLGLPPLNLQLATDMIERTRAGALLAAHRNRPASDVPAIALTLTKIAQLAADCAEIAELDINPLLVDENGVIALDARIRLRQPQLHATERLAVRPYPRELEQVVAIPDSPDRLLLRPVRPEDAHAFQQLILQLSAEDIRLRFFQPLRALPDALAARLTQIDYDREMAFVAVDVAVPSRILGVVRIGCDPDMQAGEFAVLVHTQAKHRGIGMLLMKHIMGYARSRGVRSIWADVLRENVAMLKLCRKLGFAIGHDDKAPWVTRVVRGLESSPAPG